MILSRFAAANNRRKILILIDLPIITKSVAYKMYGTLSNNMGLDTSIIYGSLRKLLSHFKTLRQLDIRNVVAVHDISGSIMHKNLYKGYKATRNTQFKKSGRYIDSQEFANDFARERDVLMDVLSALGYFTFKYDRVEGDNVLAYIIKRFFEDYDDEYAFIIVSADKDFAQLLAFSPRIIVLNPISGMFYDDSNYKDFLKVDVPISYISIARALVGDTSDNIKGVKGFGPKRVSAIINEVYKLHGHSKAVSINEFLDYITTTDDVKLTSNQRMLLLEAKTEITRIHKMIDLTNPELLLLPDVVQDINKRVDVIHFNVMKPRHLRIKSAIQLLLKEQINLTAELYYAAL